MRWLACVSALLLASAVTEAQRCGGGGVGGGATRLWLSGEHNATGHWTASLRLEKDSAAGRPGRQRLQLQLEPASWRCGDTRTDALQLTLHRISKSESVTWEEANEACEAEGARLLILNSKEEAAYAQDMIDRSLNSSSFFHVGFHDKHEEANYVTVVGEPLANTGFNQWCPGEPTGGSPEGLEHCGSIKTIKTINHAVCLNDITCNVFEAPFFCEQSTY